jgi:hypothetical protein
MLTRDTLPNGMLTRDMLPNGTLTRDMLPNGTLTRDTLPNGTLTRDTLPNQVPEDTDWTERYLCLPTNLCRSPDPNDNALGLEIVYINNLDAFPMYVFNTGQVSGGLTLNPKP